MQKMRTFPIVKSGSLLTEHEIEICQVENERIIEHSPVMRETESQVGFRRNIEKRFRNGNVKVAVSFAGLCLNRKSK